MKLSKACIAGIVALAFLIASCESNDKNKPNTTTGSDDTSVMTSSDSVVQEQYSKKSTFPDEIEEEVRICAELNDPDFNQKVYEKFLAKNILQVQQSGDTTKAKLKSRADIDRAPAAAGMRIFVWPAGYKLKVQFLEGDNNVIEKVIQHARVWEKEANIKLEFGTFADPDITIGFDETRGSWSYLGVQSKKYRPSMNFGWLYADTDDNEYARVVAHEFGHALGLIHEHQNPDGNPIRWKLNKTYAYYLRTQGWDSVEVRQNVLNRYETSQLIGTKYDPKSIMVYAIPSALTENGYSTGSNSSLSTVDKLLIKRIYPLPNTLARR